MLEDRTQYVKFIQTLGDYFRMEGDHSISDLLIPSRILIKQSDYDDWDGGTYSYTMYIDLSLSDYLAWKEKISAVENQILDVSSNLLRKFQNERIERVVISPEFKPRLDFERLSGISSREEFIHLLNTMTDEMVKVAVGELSIKLIDECYRNEHKQLSIWCSKLGIDNPFPFESLWKWWEYWKENQLLSYQSRRVYVYDLLGPINGMLLESVQNDPVFVEPSGWERVDRAIKQMRKQLADATNVEDFQNIGLLGREALISIAKEVYDPVMLPQNPETIPSETDVKRRLETFINNKLKGKSNENIRRFAKSSYDVANDVTHDRTATKWEAEICILSVTAILKLVRILDAKEEDEEVVYW